MNNFRSCRVGSESVVGRLMLCELPLVTEYLMREASSEVSSAEIMHILSDLMNTYLSG